MIIKKVVAAFTILPVHVQRSLRQMAGWFSIGFGLIGLVLPLLPGIPFLLLGIWLLGWDGRLRPWLAKRFPAARGILLRGSGTRGSGTRGSA